MNNYNSEVADNRKVFDEPYTIFQQKINKTMAANPAKDMIVDLIELQMYKNAEKNSDMLKLVELYNLLGIDKFYEVMDIMAGSTVKFPEKDDFKETIQIALSYYYKHYKDYSWDQIKEKLGDTELPTVKYGIKCQQLDRFLDYLGERVSKRYLEYGGE